MHIPTYAFENLDEKKLTKAFQNLEDQKKTEEVLATIKHIAEITTPRTDDQRGQIIGLLAQQRIICNKYDFGKNMPLIEIKPSGPNCEDRIFILVNDNIIKVVKIGKGSHK